VRYAAVLTAALLAACASNSPYSGFLKDYSKLEPHPEREGTLIWEKADVDMRDYDRLMFDDVVLHRRPGSKTELTPQQIGKATAAFRDIFIETIEPYYTVVDAPAPHVLRVRIAITDVEPIQAGISVGSASIEGELLDAQSGERLLAIVDTIEGSKKGREAQEKWRAVEGAFHEWAERLLDYMDEVHGAPGS
jgi:uncharacterized lipoprotein YmbA